MENKKITIIPNKEKINQEDRDIKIRSLLGNNFQERDGSLAKVLVFTFMNQPCSVSELKDKISRHYEEDFEKTKIYRAIEKLRNFGLIDDTTPSDILFTIPDGEQDETHKLLMAKHDKYLKTIPPQFRKNFGSVNYYWLTNGNGITYLPFCCKLLKFKIEGIKDEPREIKQ